MLKVGITGNIGSGKTVVCKIFEALGIPVYYADVRASHLMQQHGKLKQKLTEAFGSSILTVEGDINKSFIRNEILVHNELTKTLNAIVHPFVIEDTLTWIKEKQNTQVPYVLKEAAIMFETNTHNMFDIIIGVTAPEDLRIQRVKKRSGLTNETIAHIMAKQWSEEKKMSHCNYIITNDETQFVLSQVLDIHEQLLLASATVV